MKNNGQSEDHPPFGFRLPNALRLVNGGDDLGMVVYGATGFHVFLKCMRLARCDIGWTIGCQQIVVDYELGDGGKPANAKQKKQK